MVKISTHRFLRFRNGIASIIFMLLCFTISCSNHSDTFSPKQLSAAADSARLLAQDVSKNISKEGPIAWLRYFEDTTGFFMASEGHLAFPDYDSARKFVSNTLVPHVHSINLQWNNLRIDALSPVLAGIGADFNEEIVDQTGLKLSINGYFTAIAKQTAKGWRLHHAHWSMSNAK